MLAGYEKVLPGAADRIVRMAEREQEEHLYRQRLTVENAVARSRDGQRFALAIALAVLLVSAVLILMGHEVAGTILGSVDLVSLAAVFITGKITSRRQKLEQTRLLAKIAREVDDDEAEDD